MKIDRAKEIVEFLMKHHKPMSYDYSKKYPLVKKETPTKPNTQIRKYGYYFKCLFCDGNTAIKLTCSNSNCKPKNKKRKLNFYKACMSCGKDELFFVNREKASC